LKHPFHKPAVALLTFHFQAGALLMGKVQAEVLVVRPNEVVEMLVSD
jgi:hypothetical protein